MTTLQRDLALALDPCAIMRAAGIEPDAWQRQALTSQARKALWLISRQGGKSTTAAALVLHHLLETPKPLALVVSPSLRQSAELGLKIRSLHAPIADHLPMTRDTQMELGLGRGRIILLPGSETSARGYSAATLVLVDEASRVSDDLMTAIRPTLATTNGRIVCLSTPAGKTGWFYEAWTSGNEWYRVTFTADRIPRISAAFLADEKAELGEQRFLQEYMCQFVDDGAAAFSADRVLACVTPDVEPLWA